MSLNCLKRKTTETVVVKIENAVLLNVFGTNHTHARTHLIYQLRHTDHIFFAV